MKDKDKANIAFIGVGHFVSATHLKNAKLSDKCEVFALCDIDETLLAERQKQYHPHYTTNNYRKVLEDRNIDIVVIGTKQDLHAPLAAEALEAGKWVLVEKPLGETPEQLKRVVQAEKASAGRLAVGHNRRFAPAIEKVGAVLEKNSGPVFLNYRVMMYAGPMTKGFYEKRSNLVYEGCHMFDLANYVLGGYPQSVVASGDGWRNNCVICEYPDGSRFQLMMGSLGSMMMEKEYMEFFQGAHSISVRDFADIRIRGIPGQFDELLDRKGGIFAEYLPTCGADFLDVVTAEAIIAALKYDHLSEGLDQIPVEHVRRAGLDCDITKILEKLKHPDETPWEFMNRCLPDKGHFRSFEHFVECFLEQKEPRNANATDAAMAVLTAMAAIESIHSGQREKVPCL